MMRRAHLSTPKGVNGMRFSARYVPAVVVTFLSLTVVLFGQSTAPRQAAKISRGAISGRVTIKDKGVAGVAVGLRKSEDGSPFEPFQKAMTDQDGSYRLTKVAPGNYEIVLSAPAYVATDVNNTKGKGVVVGEDENVEGINFSLVRGGVITGKVTDADGRPVIQQQVSVFRLDTLNQPAGPPRPAFPSATGQTDDRGIYRIFGLPSGRFKVAVGKSDDSFTPTYTLTRSVYRQVFHPDVTDQAKATIIEVGEGTEAKDINITLGRALQTYAASGRVVNADTGQPAPNFRFGLQRIAGQRFEFVNSQAVSNSQGDFIIEGLIPGSYRVYMFPNQSSELRADTLTFDVTDQDVSGLTVRLIRALSSRARWYSRVKIKRRGKKSYRCSCERSFQRLRLAPVTLNPPPRQSGRMEVFA